MSIYLKYKKGITLIALLLTIIVMLILVTVTIFMAVNGRLFDYAKKAALDSQTGRTSRIKLSNNMSTDGLIAKYTTNKEEDLKKLRLYFIGI